MRYQKQSREDEGVAEDRTCECGNTFIVFLPEQAWKKICYECWKLRKERSERLFEERTRGTKSSWKPQDTGLEKEFQENLRALLMLCHPDKHSGSPLATRITQWLLSKKG
jgi:hypothetical protein